MLRRILILLSVAGLITYAADNAPSEASIKRLLEVAQWHKAVDTMMSQFDLRLKRVMQEVAQGQPVSPEVQEIFDQCRSDVVAIMQEQFTWDKLEPIYVRIYQKVFTQQDVDGMIAFYENKTPVDQATISKMPLVMQNIESELQEMDERVNQRVQRMQVEAYMQLLAEEEMKKFYDVPANRLEEFNQSAKINQRVNELFNAGKYSEAVPLAIKALEHIENAVGPNHLLIVSSVNSLAELYTLTGDYAKAELLYQRALKIKEKTLGLNHLETVRSLRNLAMFYMKAGNPKEAARVAVQAARAQENILSEILSFTPEQERLDFQQTARPYDLLATLGNASQLAQIVLRQKGVVMESLTEDRIFANSIKDPHQEELLKALRSAKQRLMALLLETPQDSSEQAIAKRETEKKQLSDAIDEMQVHFASLIAEVDSAHRGFTGRRAFTVTVKHVQDTLTKNEALIELLYYHHYLGINESQSRYGAVVITGRNEPKFVELKDADEIEKTIQMYRELVRKWRQTGVNELKLSQVLHALYEQVWKPIEKALPTTTKTVVISPDRELSFVPFATLLAPDEKFLAEKYSIRYVTSGRDLLEEVPGPSDMPANLSTVVFADPNFESVLVPAKTTSDSSNLFRSLNTSDLRTMSKSLDSLPGTEAEATAIKKHDEKFTHVFLKSDATEANLRKIAVPDVLYVATHGFFLPYRDLTASKKALKSVAVNRIRTVANPMYRSGLLLAGAKRTLAAWASGKIPPTENDGVVTAEEVGELELDRNWLVVLSACDTGLGEARAGEGVMGLRRGFFLAGVRNLLTTLWPISDKTTVHVMVNFFDTARRTKNAPQALADVQRDWLVKLRNESGLPAAVRMAGAFIMTSKGNVSLTVDTLTIGGLYIGMNLAEAADILNALNDQFGEAVGKNFCIVGQKDGTYTLKLETVGPESNQEQPTMGPSLTPGMLHQLQDSFKDSVVGAKADELPIVKADSEQRVTYILIPYGFCHKIFDIPENLVWSDFVTEFAKHFNVPEMQYFTAPKGKHGMQYSSPGGVRLRIYADGSIDMEAISKKTLQTLD